MPGIATPYKKVHSPILGTTSRPLVSIKLVTPERYVFLEEVMVDTGADISVVPRDIGEALCEDITRGKYIEIQGIVPTTKLIAYIHSIKIVLGTWAFPARVAVADSNNVPPVLGRSQALDRFLLSFRHGRKVAFSHFKSS